MRRASSNQCHQWQSRRWALTLMLVLALVPLLVLSAQDDYRPAVASPLAALVPPPEIVSTAAVLLDAETGTVLFAKNPDLEIPPASLAKLMTMHLVFKAAASGDVSLDEIVPIGVESWAQSQPLRSSLMFLAPGQIVTLREIMLGLAVSSGNDAAVAVSLRLAPTVAGFAAMMTQEARGMGMTKTRFVEPSGISEDNMTTAGEFAFFCQQYIRQHPESLVLFHSVAEFAYPAARNVAPAFRDNPRTIVQANRNALLKTFPGVDGLKTGYIDEAGYNIALTAERGETRFIAVILGAPARPGGERIRDQDAARLLSWAFENFKTVRPPIGTGGSGTGTFGTGASVRLWKGAARSVELTLARSPNFTAPTNRAASLWYYTEIIDPVIAPVPDAYPLGWLILSDEQGELHRVPLISRGDYRRGNWFKRLVDSIRLRFRAKPKRH